MTETWFFSGLFASFILAYLTGQLLMELEGYIISNDNNKKLSSITRILGYLTCESAHITHQSDGKKFYQSFNSWRKLIDYSFFLFSLIWVTSFFLIYGTLFYIWYDLHYYINDPEVDNQYERSIQEIVIEELAYGDFKRAIVWADLLYGMGWDRFPAEILQGAIKKMKLFKDSVHIIKTPWGLITENPYFKLQIGASIYFYAEDSVMYTVKNTALNEEVLTYSLLDSITKPDSLISELLFKREMAKLSGYNGGSRLFVFDYFDKLRRYVVMSGNLLINRINGLSLILTMLSCFITFITILYSKYQKDRFEILFYINLLLCFLIDAFNTYDLFTFFIFFELTLWPIYRLIIVWGAHEQKKRASISLVLYTIFGSLLLLLVISVFIMTFHTTDMLEVSVTQCSAWWVKLIWVPMFIAFAVKIPIFPFHHWLTLAHVEAPTAGSILLAALILKLGAFGILRFIFPMFINFWTHIVYSPLITTVCILSILFSSLIAIAQSDLKRIVAYSSISHINLSVLGLLLGSATPNATLGGILIFVAHGFVSALMFFLVGILYDRFHQRDILYYRGIVISMPIFSILFFLNTLFNIGVPISLNFLGEFLTFIELVNIYRLIFPVLLLCIILQIGYTIKLISTLFGGSTIVIEEHPTADEAEGITGCDSSLPELFIGLLLFLPTLYYGVHSYDMVNLTIVHVANFSYSTN